MLILGMNTWRIYEAYKMIYSHAVDVNLADWDDGKGPDRV